ncbi:glycoside hydrolase family 116 protein, partial [Candidatus Woesearchaeota archaeon]|nr:glycoside hydrolase family 116 protein [Candidatus Woesearchaeota archaeon]
QIPMRVGQYFVGLKLLGIQTRHKIKPRYTQDKGRNKTTDQNSLLIIVSSMYLEKTKDFKFIENNIFKLDKSIQWNLACDKDNDLLIEECYYAGWTDSIKKSGKVLYTNVLHCEALKQISSMHHKLGDKHKSAYYLKLHLIVKAMINSLFWNGQYYTDWIDNNLRRHEYFSTDGNLLAILFDIADSYKSSKIQYCIEKYQINFPTPTKVSYPNYPFSKRTIVDYLVGVGDYHSGIRWPWLGCLDVVVKFKLGTSRESKKLLKRISQHIVNQGTVHEVFEPDGTPVSRCIYRSQKPFAWNAGMFLYAVEQLG